MTVALLTEHDRSSSGLADEGSERTTTRKQIIHRDDPVGVRWWVIQTQPEGTRWSDGEPIHTTLTLRHGESSKSLSEYIGEGLGWVEPLESGFTDLLALPTDGCTSTAQQPSEHVASEGAKIAGIPVVVDSYRRDLTRRKPTKQAGAEIWRDLRDVSASGADSIHAVVWIHPGNAPRDPALWLEDCKATVGGFVGDRMDVADLEWEQVTSWLAVIHTPWATFATWASDNELTFAPVLDARVRHWVVDPVILATAQLAYVQHTVGCVADMSTPPGTACEGSSVDARDTFYAWRARNWWPRPAKSAVASAVWEGAAQANNTVGQVDALSREMADYASVEEGRHHRAVEAHNVRLGRGALVFAIVAIVVPLVAESAGLRVAGAVAVGLVAAGAVAVAGLAWWTVRSRISVGGRQHRAQT